jgi:hypothetical protein
MLTQTRVATLGMTTPRDVGSGVPRPCQHGIDCEDCFIHAVCVVYPSS